MYSLRKHLIRPFLKFCASHCIFYFDISNNIEIGIFFPSYINRRYGFLTNFVLTKRILRNTDLQPHRFSDGFGFFKIS